MKGPAVEESSVHIEDSKEESPEEWEEELAILPLHSTRLRRTRGRPASIASSDLVVKHARPLLTEIIVDASPTNNARDDVHFLLQAKVTSMSKDELVKIESSFHRSGNRSMVKVELGRVKVTFVRGDVGGERGRWGGA